jgi:hypothetical protein
MLPVSAQGVSVLATRVPRDRIIGRGFALSAVRLASGFRSCRQGSRWRGHPLTTQCRGRFLRPRVIRWSYGTTGLRGGCRGIRGIAPPSHDHAKLSPRATRRAFAHSQRCCFGCLQILIDCQSESWGAVFRVCGSGCALPMKTNHDLARCMRMRSAWGYVAAMLKSGLFRFLCGCVIDPDRERNALMCNV